MADRSDGTGPIHTAAAPGAPAAGPTPRYLTFAQLSEVTTLSVSTLRRLHRRGQIVGIQLGGPGTRVVFPADAIERAVAACRDAGDTAGPPVDESHAPRRGPRPRWLGGS